MERIRQRKGEDGLTLIEILIVVIILGILAGIVAFGVATFRGDSAKAACKTDVKSVEVASEAFRAKTGAYAANIDGLVTGGYLKENPNPNAEYTVNYVGTPPGSDITGTLTTAVDGSTDCFA